MATMHPNPSVRISDPADLIAAIPALLGFRPHRSLVALCLGGTPSVIRTVMRHDLPEGVLTTGDRVALERMALVCEGADCDAVIAVVVDDRTAAPDDDRAPGGPLVDAPLDCLGACLSEVAVPLVAAYATTGIDAGRPWWGVLGDPRCGVVADPRASEVAAAQVLRGRQIRTSRAELEHLLRPRGHEDRRRMARLLATARHPSSRTVPRGNRAALEFVLARVAGRGAAGPLADEDVAAIAVALENLAVRDCMLGLAVTAEADGVEQAWVEMARALPGRSRADPATLLAFSAYARGDGPMAGVALAVALAADPRHRLAGLLDAALRGGVRPDAIVDLAHTGRGIAADLGVTLPPVAAA